VFGIADFGAFCAATLVFLALPGPGTIALLTSTAQGGFVAGAAATAGIIVGDQVLLWLAVLGVAALLSAYPASLQGLQWAGAAYLSWVGLKLLLAPSGATAQTRPTTRRHFRQATLITLLNPKAIFFYMAFVPLFVDPARHQGLVTFAAMAVTVAAITAAYGLALCALARRVGEHMRTHRRLARSLEQVAGASLIAFGIRLGTS
jgi:threonine/homoserine/homoserine lactone efflux protein